MMIFLPGRQRLPIINYLIIEEDIHFSSCRRLAYREFCIDAVRGKNNYRYLLFDAGYFFNLKPLFNPVVSALLFHKKILLGKQKNVDKFISV